MAADPTKCKVNVINGVIVNEWTGTFGEFKGLLKPAKPPMGCSQSDWKGTLQKWLITQFFVAVLVFPVQIVLYAVAAVLSGGDVVAIITGNIVSIIVGILVAFILAWVGWFMLLKREKSCCCCCILWFEDWKYMHLVFGILTTLNGISQLLNAVQALLAALELMGTNGLMYFILYAIAAGFVAIYAITQIYVGRAAIGLGQEIAGVALPLPEGKGAEEVGAQA
jgi:hypothetical protein